MLSDEHFKKACELSFKFFCKSYLKIVEPETKIKWNWHLDVFCDVCEKVYYGEYQNIDIQVPPRTLKSNIFNVLLPCWIWTKNPSYKFLSGSSSFDLANKWNRKRRELITSAAYQMFWPIQLKDDSNTVKLFSNTSNGFMQSVSAMGKITGSGADCLLSDDLIDAKDAYSKIKRESVKHWYENVFFGRAQNRRTVRRININQRLHQNDVSDLTTNSLGFPSLVIQMQKTNKKLGTIDYYDPRKDGELLFEEIYSEKEMLEDKKSSYKWNSQLQQNPMSLEGWIIKPEWLRYYKDHKLYSRNIITADLNMKEGGDYACFQCWGVNNNDKYLIDIIRGKWSYKKTKELFIEFCSKHNYAQTKWIEDKANGPALISDLSSISLLKAWPEKPEFKRMGKVERLSLCSADFESGNVYFPENLELTTELVEELLSFTENGSATGHDDMVDTLTMALIELRRPNTFFY